MGRVTIQITEANTLRSTYELALKDESIRLRLNLSEKQVKDKLKSIDKKIKDDEKRKALNSPFTRDLVKPNAEAMFLIPLNDGENESTFSISGVVVNGKTFAGNFAAKRNNNYIEFTNSDLLKSLKGFKTMNEVSFDMNIKRKGRTLKKELSVMLIVKVRGNVKHIKTKIFNKPS